MAKPKTKSMSNNSIGIEVTLLSCDQTIELFTDNKDIKSMTSEEINALIGRQLGRRVSRVDDNITSIRLNCMAFTDSPNLRNYYEENRLFRFNGAIEYETKRRELVKSSLAKICRNKDLSKIQFSLNDQNSDSMKYLSNIERLIPRQTFKGIQSFSFGTIIDLTDFIQHYSSDNPGANGLNVAKNDIICDFQHDKKRLLLRFRLTSGGIHGKHTKNIRYKLEYEFKAINSAIFSVNENSMRIYFNVNHPPVLFKVAVDDMTVHEEYEYSQKFQKYDRRRPANKQKSYKNIESKKGVQNNEVQNWHQWLRDNEFAGCRPETIGKSNVLMVDIPLIRNETKLKEKVRELPDPYRVLYLMKRFSKIPIYLSYVETHDGSDFDNKTIQKELIDKIFVPFSLKYAYISVFSISFQSSDELLFKKLTNDFNRKVKELSKLDSKAIEDTLFEVSALIDRSAIFCTMNALTQIFDNFKRINDRIESENINIAFNTEIEYIRRCILTPTRFLVLPPQPTLKSRFLVEYDPDHTIRLSVREDDLQSLQYSIRTQNSNQSSFLSKIIKEPIMEGIPIGDRLFQFLGSSSSQLRDSGMILYAKDANGKTAESIRQSIGDMSGISRNVAKYVARLGLAFSQVMTHIYVDKRLTKVENDIESGVKLTESGEPTDEKYNFSDGIGRVSLSIMEKVYQKLRVECQHRPSAMQIRYGGCKGMLLIDPNLKGERIVFRNSMKKYESDAQMLGIIKLSAPRPLYLNRPLITILDQLGVKPKVFLTMLLDDLKNLTNAMLCECSATPLLQSSSTLGIPYRKLYKSGIPFLSEPIFRLIIDSVINHRINELKLKARIRVPMHCGRTVFGVLDETGQLEYGQVFVQLSNVDDDNMPKEDAITLEGEVMVTKFPCLHPGDVRKLTAVKVEALRHIKDCIVFPQKGKRPHPDEMAGSDLDGDEYAVIWNSDLVFEKPNEEPMIFPTSEPNLLENEATVRDILDFYCNYIVGNNVGLLASAHLANSDRLSEGIFDSICMSLAHKYAVALDFAKTGRVEKIEYWERPRLYPDFMEKFAEKRTYLSKNILGQLYRHCDRFALGMQSNKNIDVKAEPNPHIPLIEGWEKYIQSATDAYKAYREKVGYLLNRFGVNNEAILLSGAFSKTSKYMTGRTETNDVHELLENLINKLFIEFKTRFNKECNSDNETERLQRASAWYMIPFQVEDDGSNERYFGFSWTITEEICNLMKTKNNIMENKANKRNVNCGHRSQGLSEEHECVRMATQLIDSYFHRNFIYREPVVDKSITDESHRRQVVMEKRCESAEVVLKAWLERQDHLFFKRKVGKKLVSSTDYVMSDMDRKLRRKLMEIRIQVLSEARDELDKPLKTAGYLVMNFLKQSVDEWLDIKTLDLNNRIVDTPLVKFGFSALITLNHFFKTRDISHIIYLGQSFQISLPAPIRDNTYYIPLPIPSKKTDYSEQTKVNGFPVDNRSSYHGTHTFRQYVQYMVQYPEKFCDKLKRISGAIDVYLEPYELSTLTLQHYYLLTATGTVWSLQTIKNFICHPMFFKTVANSDRQWKKRNLWCKGMPDFRPNNSVEFKKI